MFGNKNMHDGHYDSRSIHNGFYFYIFLDLNFKWHLDITEIHEDR